MPHDPIKTIIRSDSSSNWFARNEILSKGEIASESDTGRIKLGDGVLCWQNLPYIDQAGDTGATGPTGDRGDRYSTIAIGLERNIPHQGDAVLIQIPSGFAYSKAQRIVVANSSSNYFTADIDNIIHHSGITQLYTTVRHRVVRGLEYSPYISDTFDSWSVNLYSVDAVGITGSTGITGPIGVGVTGPQGAVSTVPGPQGIPGPAGIQGVVGPVGPQGPQGNIGLTGPQGADSTVPGPTGSQGPQGNIGLTGPQGSQGNVGSTGSQGPQGNVGSTGPQGNAGSTGSQGPQGNVGSTGPQGSVGSTGPQGADSTVPGPTGPQGTQGVTGPQGADSTVPGPTGAQGMQGVTGPQGADSTVPGPTGSQGSQGVTGPQGAQGNQGIQGITGPYGGPSGATGPTGATGVSDSPGGGMFSFQFAYSDDGEWNSTPASVGKIAKSMDYDWDPNDPGSSCEGAFSQLGTGVDPGDGDQWIYISNIDNNGHNIQSLLDRLAGDSLAPGSAHWEYNTIYFKIQRGEKYIIWNVSSDNVKEMVGNIERISVGGYAINVAYEDDSSYYHGTQLVENTTFDAAHTDCDPSGQVAAGEILTVTIFFTEGIASYLPKAIPEVGGGETYFLKLNTGGLMDGSNEPIDIQWVEDI